MTAPADSPPRRPVVQLDARCACGGIRLAVDGEIKAMLLCSCLACQQMTGTGHATVALVSRDAVSVEGSPKDFARPADSGATLTRWFCPDCGTPLYAQSSRAPALALLSVGLFGAATGWFAPSQLIFARSHHDWDGIPPDLPRHMSYREERSSHV